MNYSVNSINVIPKKYLNHFPEIDGDWIRYSVSGNGSCFYNSVAAALNYKNYIKHSAKSQEALGRNLRRQFQREINDVSWSSFWKYHNLEHKAPGYQDARKQVANPKTWANLWTIYVFSCWTRTNFVFHDMSNNAAPYCGITINSDSCPPRPKNCQLPDSNWNLVLIAWTNRAHFDPIMILKNHCKSCQTPSNRSQLVKKNHNLVMSYILKSKIYQDILKKYEQGTCSGKTIKDAAFKN